MHYRLYSISTLEPCDAVEMHVLARAYWAAWRSVHARAPRCRHVLAEVDLLIDFDPGTDDTGYGDPDPTLQMRGRESPGSRSGP